MLYEVRKDNGGSKYYAPLSTGGGSELQAGAIISCRGAVPEGWLPCDGSEFDTEAYPALKAALNSSRVPLVFEFDREIEYEYIRIPTSAAEAMVITEPCRLFSNNRSGYNYVLTMARQLRGQTAYDSYVRTTYQYIDLLPGDKIYSNVTPAAGLEDYVWKASGYKIIKAVRGLSDYKSIIGRIESLINYVKGLVADSINSLVHGSAGYLACAETFGVCSSPADDIVKDVTIINSFTTGSVINVEFENAHTKVAIKLEEDNITPSNKVSADYPMLSVNGGTAYPIMMGNEYVGEGCWEDGAVLSLVFTGSAWKIVGGTDLIYKGGDSTNGYYEKKRSGLITVRNITRFNNTSYNSTIKFPIPFSNTDISVFKEQGCDRVSGRDFNSSWITYTSFTKFDFTVNLSAYQTGHVYGWMAIGY